MVTTASRGRDAGADRPRLPNVSRSARAQWWHAAGCAAAAVLAATLLLSGAASAILAAPAVALLTAGAYLCSPLHRRAGASHWEAQQRLVAAGVPVVYWRPGCPYCVRMRLALSRAGLARDVSWVDVWSDAEGAAYVRDLNDGSETVPTVILPDGSAVTNPPPQGLVEAISRAATAATVAGAPVPTRSAGTPSAAAPPAGSPPASARAEPATPPGPAAARAR